MQLVFSTNAGVAAPNRSVHEASEHLDGYLLVLFMSKSSDIEKLREEVQVVCKNV
jgi:hypothetical protein